MTQQKAANQDEKLYTDAQKQEIEVSEMQKRSAEAYFIAPQYPKPSFPIHHNSINGDISMTLLCTLAKSNTILMCVK